MRKAKLACELLPANPDDMVFKHRGPIIPSPCPPADLRAIDGQSFLKLRGILNICWPKCCYYHCFVSLAWSFT